MNNMSSNKNFLVTMNFLYIFGKFVGMSCYSLSKGHQTEYKASFEISNFMEFTAFITLYLVLLYYNLENGVNITNDAKNTIIFNSAQQILIVTSLIFLLGGTFKVVLLRHRFWKIANSLNEIDNQMMELLKIQINHDVLYRRTVTFVGISYSALFIVNAMFGYIFSIIVKGVVLQYIITFCISNSGFVFITIQFQVLMYSMYLRFSVLNEFVESIVNQGSIDLLPKTLELKKNIIAVAKINDQLNNLVPTVSLYFSTFMIPAIGGVFAVTVFNFHNFFRAISEKTTYHFYLLILCYDKMIFLFNVWFFICIVAAHMNITSARRMGVLVHKIIARTRDQQSIMKLKILSQQILHRSPNFSFGLFSLNWPFAFTYVASVASYLVIVIQFENYITESSDNMPVVNTSKF